MKTLNAVHLSTLLLTGVFLFAVRAFPALAWAGGALILSLLHFAATLSLFYRPGSAWREQRLLALGAPLFLFGGAFLWAYASADTFGKVLVGFFPLLYWHYAKQSMGIFVLSLREGPGMADPRSVPRQLVLGAFLLFGLYGYLSTQIGSGTGMRFGFYIPSLGLAPGPWIYALRTLALAGLFYCAFLAIREKRYLALGTPLAFYLWMDAPLTGYALIAILPALHAIQYLPIAIERGARGPRAFWFAAIVAALAAALFVLLRATPRDLVLFGLGVGAAEIMLNLHHYLLDAYIWRARDESNRRAMGLEKLF